MRTNHQSLWLPFENPNKPPKKTLPAEALAKEGLPRVHTLEDVKAYLAKHLPKINHSPETFPPESEALHWEELLLTDLHTAKSKQDAERINHLRSLLYALSWQTHERPETKHLLQLVDQLDRWVKEEASRRGGKGSSPDDEREYLAEQRPHVNAIREAIRSNTCGAQAEKAVQAIEYFVDLTWETLREQPQKKGKATIALQDRLKFLRPLRDQIYYQFVYGPWCETAPHKTRH